MSAPTLDIVSIGKACSILQAHPARIREAADELKIQPAARLNCVDYFDAVAIEQIRQRLLQGVLESPKPLV